MITVIIAGGSGTRLWPLSTPAQPKQLLALTSERTLVQQAYDRAVRLGGDVYIITEASHSDALRAQLPELPDEAFLIEPGRRGTGNCIIFALDRIARTGNTDEPIAFVHADHNIRDVDGYVQSIRQAAEASSTYNRVTLVGIEPTFPSTALGYIERDGALDTTETAFAIESFKEKPEFETAKKYFESGKYYWNCGYFVGSVNTFLDEINVCAPEMQDHYGKLSLIDEWASDGYNQAYLGLEPLVIDYSLSEKSRNLAVTPARFDWADIGNFKDLYDSVPTDEQGLYVHGENIHTIEAENAFIRNEEPGKPVAVIGLDNVVVVNTSDGILVARKDVAAKCGDVAKKLQA